jgi:hypothetical protein
LAEADRRRRLKSRLAECFVDHRDPERTEHGVGELVRQRLYALALGDTDSTRIVLGGRGLLRPPCVGCVGRGGLRVTRGEAPNDESLGRCAKIF